jgi:hypothetical protein
VRRFDPAELSEDPGALTEAELTGALAMARDLEAIAERETAPTAGFSDRVMAAVAAEPTPEPTRVFGSAIRTRRFRAALAAVGDAWRVAFGSGRPFAVRSQALALVLIVLIGVVSLGGGAAVGAARLLNPDVAPSPAPSPSVPPPSPTPAPSNEPTPTPSVAPSPTPTPEASPTDTDEPNETPDATETDDSGGNSGPGGGGSNSGSSGSSGSGSSKAGSDDTLPDDSDSGSGGGSGSDDSR